MRWPTWLRERPWLWVVVLYLFVMGVWAAFVMLAHRNPPLPADGYSPPAP